MSGNPILIEALIYFNQKRKSPIQFGSEEVTISAGATYGIFAALVSVISFGDEVIVLEPNYDFYIPALADTLRRHCKPTKSILKL